ncbi:MAG: MazG nucleotide pyrophosphohydrolase domain-containing protein [Actinomycetota bacterium]
MSPPTVSDLPQVTICGLGPGGPHRLTAETARLLAGDGPVFLRTSRHPGIPDLANVSAFDHLYESADSFDEVYRRITTAVSDAAEAEGHVVYAVPGSPLILERSVRYLRDSDRIEVTLLPAVSFLDEVWATLQVDPVETGVRLVDGLRFATDAASERGPLLVAHTHSNWVLSDIKLALDAGDEQRVIVMQALGTADERVFEIGWPDLDRAVEADHLTTLYIPELAAPVGAELAASVEMMQRLRQDCPWDRQQTHRSLRKYLIEEAYEVLDAIDALGGPDAEEADAAADARDGHRPNPQWPAEVDLAGYADLEEELGDLWFQILFHAQLAAEAGQFTIADVAAGLREKMIRRHPHVYGPDGAGRHTGTEELAVSWEQQKLAEKGRGSILDGIPGSLPALALAEKYLKKADGAGSRSELGPLGSEVARLLGVSPTADDVGLILMTTVELARRLGLNAEQALRSATKRAGERFREAERSGTADPDWVRG